MTDISTPKLPLTRTPSSNGYIWRQADGSVFSATEYADWLWAQLEELETMREDRNYYDYHEQRVILKKIGAP